MPMACEICDACGGAIVGKRYVCELCDAILCKDCVHIVGDDYIQETLCTACKEESDPDEPEGGYE